MTIINSMYKVFSNSYRIFRTSLSPESSNISSVYRFLRTTSNGGTINTPVPDYQVSQTTSPDILLKNMKSATDTSDILHSVKMHHTIMNSRHLMQAFRSIFLLQKSEHSNMSNGEITKSQEFKLLCQALKSQAGTLDIDDRIDALKTLSFLGVTATSKIVQVLLQTVTKDVNDLSLQKITFFDFLIKDFESCSLVDALRIALPIVFEANLKTKVDPDSLPHLTELLHYSTRKNLTVASLYLINLIMTKRSEMDFKTARSIVRSICDLKAFDIRYRPLLQQALDVMIDNESICTYQDYDILISKMASRFSAKNNYFYHEEFMNSAIKFIITNNAGYNEGVWFLRKATKYGHVSHELLDYLMEKIEKNPQLIVDCGTITLFSIVSGLAQADYRPSIWSTIEPLIIKNAISHLNHIELPWMKFTRDLCTLDCWPFEIFQRIFSSDFLDQFLHRGYNKLDFLQLVALYQAVKSLCPWYTGPWPPQEILNEGFAINGAHIAHYPLAGAISQGLGGTRYLLNGVYTRLGHFIDNLVTMRKGGYPVPFINIKDERIFVEDLPKNDECQMIAMLYLPPSAFTVNANKLKGSTRLAINSLEVCGPTVVYVNSSYWEQLMDSEKILYIMDLLKAKTCS